MMHIPES